MARSSSGGKQSRCCVYHHYDATGNHPAKPEHVFQFVWGHGVHRDRKHARGQFAIAPHPGRELILAHQHDLEKLDLHRLVVEQIMDESKHVPRDVLSLIHEKNGDGALIMSLQKERLKELQRLSIVAPAQPPK